MYSKKKRNAGGNQKPTPNIQSDDYDLKKNFSRINTYRETSRTEPTLSDNCVFCQQSNPAFNSSIYQQTQRETTADQLGNTYFQLDNKIDKLSDKIESSNKDLRKELEEKIDKVKDQSKDNIKWMIGIGITIIIAIGGFFLIPYKKYANIENRVVEIETVLKIRSSMSDNTQKCERDTTCIRLNSEK